MAKRTALLIANDAYEDEDLARLNAPWDDVVRLREALAAVGEFDIMTPLHNQDIGDIQTAVTELFQAAGPDDTILLYYTGHGVRDRNGHLHFALKRTQVDRLPANTLSASFVRDAMKDSQAAAQVVILDCCHSGQFIREGAKRKSTPEPLQKSDLMDTDAGDVAVEGKYILTASEPDQSAYEAGGQSVFTRYLVDGLVNGTAAPEKEHISIEDLHAYLYRTLRAEGVPQQPMKMFASSAPRLIIGRNPNPRLPVPESLARGLFSQDRHMARGAFEELKEIAEGTDEQRAGDARKLMQQRLDQKDDLLAAVADPIRDYLIPAKLAVPDPAKLELAAAVEQISSKLDAERQKRQAEATAWLARERELTAELEKANTVASARSRGDASRVETLEKNTRTLDAELKARTADWQKREEQFQEKIADLQSETAGKSVVAGEPGSNFRSRVVVGALGLAAATSFTAAIYLYIQPGADEAAKIEAFYEQKLENVWAENRTMLATHEAEKEKLREEAERQRAEHQQQVSTLETDLQTVKGLLADAERPPEELAGSDLETARDLMKLLGIFDGEINWAGQPKALEAVNDWLVSLNRRPVDKLRADTLTFLKAAAVLKQPRPETNPTFDLGTACDACPDMVKIEGGTFMMGSPANEEGRDDYEDQRNVTVTDFAIARTEVTFDQWQACVDDGGCESNPEPNDGGWGRGSRPVINVSWNDTQEYIAWLNTKVERGPFRLPSEAEWEYAARAGTAGRFSNKGGEAGLCEIANHADQETDFSWKNSACSDGYGVQTATVASFQANGSGLYDMHGNVWEWVEDVYADYDEAPTDGTVYVRQPLPDGHSRVVRGGSWGSNPRYLRSAARHGSEPGSRSSNFGFRPARTLLTP